MYDTLTLDELYDLHSNLSADHTARHARLMDPKLSIWSDEYAALSAKQAETDETARAVYAEITRREQEASPVPDLTAAEAFTGHWVTCGPCQDGLPCPDGDPLWAAMNKEAAADA